LIRFWLYLNLKQSAKYVSTLVSQFKDFDGYKKVLLASGKSAVHDT
jgi:hypothetical protein